MRKRPQPRLSDGKPRPRAPRARWFSYPNLKVEAGIFLLILATFAAVLCRGAITRQDLSLTPGSAQFFGYAFSDAESGGDTVVTLDPVRPLSWSCRIGQRATYPYCGYGLLLTPGGKAAPRDLSHIQTVTLRLSYHGDGGRLKLVAKTLLPPAVRARAGGEAMPSMVEFPVAQGANTVTIPLSRLAPEGWWLVSHGVSGDDATPDFGAVKALAITTADVRPGGHLAASIDEMALHGDYFSTEQWYLILLAVWLLATGGFMVRRVLRMRRDYEAREQRRTREALTLARAHAAAEAASNAKSRFLGNMSHELRTPLNAVIGYAYWLSHGPLDPKQRDAIKAIQSSGEHLLAMITDILDVAKIEAGKLDLVPAPFDLHEAVDGVARMMRLRAEEKRLDFAVAVAADVPRRIVTDQKRLGQVLINLLGNAVKFTAEGRVGLAVSVLARDGETVRLRFVVEDTGAGIAPQSLETIFRPFEQACDAVERGGGAGLGLSITRQIVELMDGQILVDSTPGVGSRFTVEAAFQVARAETPAALTVGT